MAETIQLGEFAIALTRKNVKHVHLSVHSPAGRVTLVAPTGTRLEVARAYAISKLGWIRKQQAILLAQARESQRRYIGRESHCLWGRCYLLSVVEKYTRPSVKLDRRRILLAARPGSSAEKREGIMEEIMEEWLRSLPHGAIPALIRKWEPRLGVAVSAYFLQRIKTKWGSCNHQSGNFRPNTELVKKPKDLLECVVVHEMAHLIEPKHGERFVALLDKHLPTWREARMELNELPLGAEHWGE